MNNLDFKKMIKNILISFNIFCLGVITYYVFRGDFTASQTLQVLAISVWLHYVSGDIVKKISE